MTDRVAAALIKLAELYETRNAEYGDDYKHHGQLMMALFPKGIELRSEADFARYALFKMIAVKLARYAVNFHRGGHRDSLDDIAVYSQLLQELDGGWGEKENAPAIRPGRS